MGNKTIDLLYLAKQNGINILLEEDKLQLKIPKNTNKNIVEEIKENKDLIIEFLKNNKRDNNKYQKITKGERSAIQNLPLSFSQERLWFIDRLEGSLQYHMNVSLHLRGKLNTDALIKSLQYVVNRHEVLRTVIVENEGFAFQQIQESDLWELNIIDGTDYRDNNPGLQPLLESLIKKPFDLSKDYMLRAELIKLSTKEHWLNITLHHIASDGWSMGLIVKEVASLYKTFVEGLPIGLPALEIQYVDYSIWQRNYLQGELLEKKISYWKEKLEGIVPLELPTDYQRPAVLTTHGTSHNFNIEKKLSGDLYLLSQEEGSTLFMILLAGINILLHKYSGQEDISIGSAVANRTQKELENLVGFFVNTLVLRNEVRRSDSFLNLLQQVKATSIGAYEHQDVPFEKVVEAVVKERDNGRNPLFQVMVVLQNTPQVKGYTLGNLHLTQELLSTNTSKFELTFSLIETDDGLAGSIEYNTDLYKADTIERMAGHFVQLLKSIVKNPSKKISKLRMLSAFEEDQLLKEFNAAEVAYRSDKNIIDLFEEQVLKTPGNIAVVFEGKELTYSELNKRSNQLARYFRSKGVGEETLVPICIERSIEMIVGIMGILKAGGSYVPIDPEYPQDRISYMLEDTGASVIVSSKGVSNKLPELSGIEIIEIDSIWEEIEKESGENPHNKITPHNLAYIIYTSGSTGKPKGVMIEHRNVVRLFETEKPLFDFNERDVWTMFHSFCFDFSVWEMYGALLYGGRLVIVPASATKDTILFADLLIKENVTILNQTPSSFYVLQDILTEKTSKTNIRYVIFGGEALSPAKVKPWKQLYNNCRIINMYGITETTVHVTYQEIGWKQIENGNSIIGKTIPTLNAYILDSNQNLQPVGITGELCIGGAGLARGYLNRDDLTAQRFVKNPFSNGEDERIYKSGDLGRWLPDGTLEYLGRMDDQVKIRGFRIELGEIETVILQSGLIKQVVVLARSTDDGSKRLVGYIVPKENFEKQEIISFLHGKLPDYMIPGLWVNLEKLPLTSNGKIDKRALPEIDASGLLQKQYVAPSTDDEWKVAEIWKDLLNVERVGIHDNFFELGGDSIKVIRVVNKLKKVFQKDVKVFDIYHANTLYQLIPVIYKSPALETNKLLENIGKEIEVLKSKLLPVFDDTDNIEDIYPMSDIQTGMVYSSQINPELAIYHDQFCFQIKEDVDKNIFEQALLLLINKHEIFRTAFDLNVYAEGMQVVYKTVPFRIEYIDLRNTNSDEKEFTRKFLAKEQRSPFKVDRAPLWRFTIIHYNHHNELVFQFHHALLDGWSVAAFNTELNNLYIQLLTNPSYHSLMPLKISYKDFIIESLADKNNEGNKEFWLNEMNGYKRLDIFSREATSQNFTRTYSEQYLDLIDTKAKKDGLSLKSLFFGAYLYSLSLLTPGDELTIGIVSNTRPTLEDGDKLLGCFLNTIPVRFKTSSQRSTWRTFFDSVENKLVELKQRDRATLLQITNITNEKSSYENPFFDALFSFINFHVYDNFDKRLLKGDKNNTESVSFEEDSIEQVTNTYLNCLLLVTGKVLRIQYRLRKKLISGKSLLELNSYFDKIISCYLNHYDEQIDRKLIIDDEDIKLQSRLNENFISYPSGVSVVELFEKEASKAPEAIAVVFGEKRYSYGELNEKSNQLAHYLRSRGVGEDTLVPLFIERSAQMIVGILGVLKAGGAYVPIDTEFPAERISYMLEDTGAKVIVSSEISKEKLGAIGEGIEIIEIDSSKINSQAKTNPEQRATAKNLAYVIYTSGSTGNPKGVMIEHRSLVDYVYGLKEATGIENCKSHALVSTIATDLGNTVLYSSLLTGGALHVFTKEAVSDIYGLHKYFKEQEIECLKIVPSHWKALSKEEALLLPTKLLVFGGEALHTELTEAIEKTGTSCQVVNHYGPTETTIGKLLHVVEKGRKYNKTIPIGKPFSNTQVYVLSKDMELCPIGVPGQLYIAGDGVARGYLNNEALTRSKFVANPFRAGTVMYSTGDQVKYLGDGNIEFIGRVDNQVKIRGYRIELGEIESILQQSEQVRQGVVIAREDKQGNKKLVAYIVPRETFDREAIYDYLKEKLPEYMAPSVIVELENLPLTANGKVDRKALPDPEATETHGGGYVAPRNTTEEKLAEIWAEILEVDQVDIHDDFFELGGHSLLAIRLISMIRKELGSEVKIGDVFDYPTIALLSDRLKGEEEAPLLPTIEVKTRPEKIPLSFSQERLWFIDQLEGSVQYHLPTVLRLKGKLDTGALEYSLQQIVNRHEVLRTVFREEGGVPYQYIKEKDKSRVEKIEGKQYKEDPEGLRDYIKQLVKRPFDLKGDDMLRVYLIELGEEEHVLITTMHHIASDAWSTSVMVREVAELYNSYIEKRESKLKEMELQYADYSIWQRNYLKGEVLEKKIAYWKEKLNGVTALALPTDYKRPSVQSTRGAFKNFKIGKELSEQIKELSRQEGTTMFITLQAVYKAMLYRYSGQEDISVGTSIARREQQQLEGLIGFFVNTLALRDEVKGEQAFKELLQQVRQTTMGAYEHQEVPFEKVVEVVVKERDKSRSPLFQVMLVFKNTPEVGVLKLGDIELSGDGYEHTTVKFELTFFIQETGEGLRGSVHYCSDLYKEATIGRMVEHFTELLKSVVKDPGQKIDELQMLTEEEQQLLLEFN